MEKIVSSLLSDCIFCLLLSHRYCAQEKKSRTQGKNIIIMNNHKWSWITENELLQNYSKLQWLKSLFSALANAKLQVPGPPGICRTVLVREWAHSITLPPRNPPKPSHPKLYHIFPGRVGLVSSSFNNNPTKTTIWLFNIAMENPQNKWRFLAGKIIYKWAIYTIAMLVITRG